jgi:transcriptional regulator with XRE-family HTH domain
VIYVFKIKAPDGTNNLCGRKVRLLRERQSPPISQRRLAQMMQIRGYDVDNHFVRRIELGERFVTDIELKALAEIFDVTYAELLD